MRVKLDKAWFAPSAARKPNVLTTISGKRYRAGVHELPEDMRPYLPKTAVVLDDAEPVVVHEAEVDERKEADVARQAAADLAAVNEAADAFADVKKRGGKKA
jgi:hypothetical protein